MYITKLNSLTFIMQVLFPLIRSAISENLMNKDS